MKVLRFIHPAIIASALALEAMPWGAVCNFALPPEEGGTLRMTYSYFDLLPFGYANVGPLFTALLTCALAVFAIIGIFRPDSKRVLLWLNGLSLGGVIASLMPLMFGLSYYSLIGLAITLLLGGSLAVSLVRALRPADVQKPV